jgi:hypothetical protein
MPVQSSTESEIKRLHLRAAALLAETRSISKTVAALVEEGVDPGYARLLVNNVMNDQRDDSDAWRLLIMGLFFVFGGLGINYYSYQIAVQSNSYIFYVFWGIVVTGIVFLYKAYGLFRR